MAIPLFQIDAFTQQLYSGNPAVVCLLRKEKSVEWMRSVAAEMNVSETAFVWPVEQTKKGSVQGARNSYYLKWFTPTVEVSLCGHATLATASVLWQESYAAHREIEFNTLSGILTAKQKSSLIELSLPQDIVKPCRINYSAEILAILGFTNDEADVFQGKEDIMLVLQSTKKIIDLNPDFSKLSAIQTRAIIVTAATRTSSKVDFVARVFVPSCGINEDPVTGSAYCLMGPYWSRKLNKTTLKATQLSARGGELEMSIEHDRLLLRGNTTAVFKAELYDNE